MSKTIPQLDPASSLTLTDKLEVSQSDASSAESKSTTYQDFIDYIVNPNAELDASQIISGILPLNRGGTNNVGSYSTQSVIYHSNSGSLIGTAGFTWSGLDLSIAPNTSLPCGLFISNDSPILGSAARITLRRGDVVNGTAYIKYHTGNPGTTNWNVGIFPGSTSYEFKEGVGSTTLFKIDTAGNVNINNLTASQLVGTDSSKNLVSVPVVSIASGGTNTNSQSNGGLCYFDGTKLTTNDRLYYNGTSQITFLNTGGNVNLLLYGGVTNADSSITLRRFDSGSSARVVFLDDFQDQWACGMYNDGGTASFYIRNLGNSVNAFRIDESSNRVAIDSLDASSPVFTNASKELTNNGTMPQDHGGTNNNSGYGANRLIFQNSGNTAFSSSANLTYSTNLSLIGGSFAGDFNDGDKVLFLGTTNGAKIRHNSAWNVQNFSGAFTSAGGAINTGQFSWLTVDGTGAAFSTRMTLSNTGVLNLSSLTASSPVFTDGSKNLVSTGTLAASQGGTGQTSYTIGDIIYASGSTTISKLSDIATGNALISGGVGGAPGWGKIDLTTHVSNTLPQGSGGTNKNSAYSASGIIYQNSGNTAFTNGTDFTFNGTKVLTISTSSANPGFQVTTTLTGAANSANLSLQRGDLANGANNIYFQTAGSTDWLIRQATNVSDIMFTSFSANKEVLSLGLSTFDVTAGFGNLIINTVGKGLSVKGAAVSGGTANAFFVTGVVMSGGTSGVINNSAVTTACAGFASISTVSTASFGYTVICFNGSFEVRSGNPADNSTLNVCFIKGI